MRVGRKKRDVGVRLPLFGYLSVVVCLLMILSIGAGSLAYSSFYQYNLLNSTKINSQQVIQQAKEMLDIQSRNMAAAMQMVRTLVETDGLGDISASNRSLNQALLMRQDILGVMIYSEAGKLLTYGSHGLLLTPDEMSRSTDRYRPFTYAGEKMEQIYISPPHVQRLFQSYYPWVISLVSRVKLPGSEAEIFLVMDFDFTEISRYINRIGVGEAGYCFVVNERNELVFHPHQQLLHAGLKEENLHPVAHLENGFLQQDDTIYTVVALDSVNWRVVGKSRTGDLIDRNLSQLYITLSYVFIVSAILMVFVFALFRHHVSRPARDLIAAMQAFERENEDFSYRSRSRILELDRLSASFAGLVDRVKRLVQEVREEEISLRKTELKALQTQINPHFLYNTLDSILWMCEQDRQREAIPMIEALAALFRISISKGRDLITIADEKRHVENYLKIQSIRYDGAFHYAFEVDPVCLPYLCNKITLQPLVENALYHGIEGMIDEGEIIIRIEDGGDLIRMSVEDNGIGMSAERVAEILSDQATESVGIGVSNVNSRIKIFFGDEYGLSIKSLEGEGTCVMVTFPKITEYEDRR